MIQRFVKWLMAIIGTSGWLMVIIRIIKWFMVVMGIDGWLTEVIEIVEWLIIMHEIILIFNSCV
jgi:hypothetical protein